MPSAAVSSPNLVLASSSPRRIELVKNLGLKFEILPSDLDEVVNPALTPGEVVADLAQSKAARVQELIQERGGATAQGHHVILAADTIVVFEGDILGKPTDRDHAIAMLTRLVGNIHEVYTGVHVISVNQKEVVAHHEIEVAKVEFRQLSASEIANYVDSKEPMDKAGSYALQGIGAFMINKIEGSPSNIIGLPLVRTINLLRQCGVQIMGE
ncbi:MAG: nucleoside triphosphate pyrophosphatase [Candidatus Obscuribacterales bacterium]|jgi:septum formation protein